MNRPILVISIGYIIGIIWGLYFKISIVFLFAIIVLIYLLINTEYPTKRFKLLSVKRYCRYIKIYITKNLIIIFIISIFISNINVKIRNQKFEEYYQNKELKIQCKVIEEGSKYKIKILNSKNINLYLITNKKYKKGDILYIEGDYIEPEESRNFKGFNYKEYLKTLNIYGSIKSEKIEKIGTSKSILNDISIKIQENINKTYDKEFAPIMLGILLGKTDEISDEIKEDFSISGISHVLAVSGMHVVYITYLVITIIQKLFGKKIGKIFSCLFLMFYMYLTNFSVSVVRAGIMGILSCMSFVVYRKNDTKNNLAISSLIILVYNPYNLLSLSFQLTFLGTIGILTFQSNIKRIMQNIRVRNKKWKYVFIKLQRMSEQIIDIVSVSLSAQIAILPILLIRFNSIGIAFLITNLLLNIVIGKIIMGGILQIIISFFSINLGILIAHVIEILLKFLMFISKIGSKIPFSNITVKTPYLITIVIYYIICILFNKLYFIFSRVNPSQTQIRIKNLIYLFKFKIKPYKRKIRILSGIIVIIIVFATKIPGKLNIHFIDVGQGDSTLIVTPFNKTILIDGGGSKNYDVGKNILVPYLLNRRINKIDYMIISHFDQDHCDGLKYVIQKLIVKNIIIGSQYEEYENYKEIVEIAMNKNIHIEALKNSNTINIENNLYINILWPSNDLITENSINNNSLVCKLTYKDFSILFTGDIEESAEKAIIENYKNNPQILQANILKVAHHGSKTSSISEFIKCVNPQYALIGVGKNNTFGHPSDITIDNLTKYGVDIYRTDECGEITIKTNGRDISLYKNNKTVNNNKK